ncbi:class F sortase [Candidatus Kaiserbacteria bacterium]|nr:class F sortase [Candidatus Kaiserbacteria bacterium]
MSIGIRRYALQISAGIVTLAALAVFADTLMGALWYSPDTEVPVPEIEQVPEEKRALPEDQPARLRVPSLEIDAFIQHVGVNAKGNMAAPSNFVDVGWYKYGTTPGFTGSAVVTGHVDNALGLPGVFKELDKMRIGDDIFVEAQDGEELHFRVVEIQRYPYTLVPLKVLFSRSDLPRLNLITCSGKWLQSERSYDERLVVYAELVSG